MELAPRLKRLRGIPGIYRPLSFQITQEFVSGGCLLIRFFFCFSAACGSDDEKRKRKKIIYVVSGIKASCSESDQADVQSPLLMWGMFPRPERECDPPRRCVFNYPLGLGGS